MRIISYHIVSCTILLVVTVAIACQSLVTARTSGIAAEVWQVHRDACLRVPPEAYHVDRARELRGVIRDTEGRPIAGGLVRCVLLRSLARLAQQVHSIPVSWSDLVEAETRTDSDGRYSFPSLPEGTRMVCVSAPGFAPAVRGPIIVQDGMGARVDMTLDPPETLRIRIERVGRGEMRRVYLVPYRWWPDLFFHDVTDSDVEISGLGGPFRQGLVLLTSSEKSTDWKIIGSYDLDRSHDVTLSSVTETSVGTIPEAACLAPWRSNKLEADRLFFSMLSPIALFWPVADARRPERAPSGTSSYDATSSGGGLRGYARGAFLPILIESRDGRAWFEWSSEASEFERAGLAPGVYRVRSLNVLGQVSFARGLVASPSGVTELETALNEQIRLDDPSSREVMGVVRWEDGHAVEGAEVFFQDSTNFRRFLKRVQTDGRGFFRVPGVPGGARYFIFALPPQDKRAMKDLIFLQVESTRREVWVDLMLSPHNVVGRLADLEKGARVELVRKERNGPERVVWTTVPEQGGQFEITNVPHGSYFVRAMSAMYQPVAVSSPFAIERETTAVVRWPDLRVGPHR
jgi:hypothetical protein